MARKGKRSSPAASLDGQTPATRTRRISRVDASRASDSTRVPKGRLILIGGAEDREGEMVILKRVAARARDGLLAVFTAASGEPDEMWSMYRRIFEKLGARDIAHVDI